MKEAENLRVLRFFARVQNFGKSYLAQHGCIMYNGYKK